jgi:hypothetical protein
MIELVAIPFLLFGYLGSAAIAIATVAVRFPSVTAASF